MSEQGGTQPWAASAHAQAPHTPFTHTPPPLAHARLPPLHPASDFGEPPGLWPYVSSSFGQLCLAGFPKPHAYWYTANWRDLKGAGATSTVRVLDLLDAPLGTQGGITATTSAASAELFADGASLGAQSGAGAQLFWKLPGSSSGNCSWPVRQDGTQCKGLTAVPGATSAALCKAHACAHGLMAWQWGSSDPPHSPPACWAGAPASDPGAACPPPPSPAAQWSGASRPAQALAPANATLVARDAGGAVVGVHTVLAPAPGPPAALLLLLDAPSPASATGSRLLLDGLDCALLRAALTDAAGALVSTAPANVTFTVLSGPGRLTGVGSGDPAAHEQPAGPVVATFGGLARAIVGAAVDCVSAGRDRARAVDVEGALGPVQVLPEGAACPGEDVVVAAEAPGLPRVTLRIPTSGDAGVDGVLAVARASAGSGGAGAVAYLADFVG